MAIFLPAFNTFGVIRVLIVHHHCVLEGQWEEATWPSWHVF